MIVLFTGMHHRMVEVTTVKLHPTGAPCVNVGVRDTDTPHEPGDTSYMACPLEPDEARDLGRCLLDAADEIDAEASCA